jgi:putative DNA primase/helicase
LHEQGERADLLTVEQWLGTRLEAAGGREYLTRLVDEARDNGAYLFDQYLRILKKGQSSVVSCESPVNCQAPVFGVQSSVARQPSGPDEGVQGDVASMQPAALSTGRPVERAGARLLEDLKSFFERYVVLPPRAAETLALWTVHTYAWRLGSVTTYLGVVSGTKRCGKTKLLTCLHKVVHRPEFASNITPPAVFYAIEETQPTLLIDEVDTFLAGKNELRGILNAGYTRDSAYVLRVERRGQKSPQRQRDTELRRETESRIEASEGNEGKAHRSQLARFSCWCPKVIAMIGTLPDTLADRCVVIEMERKTTEQKSERLRDFDGSELRGRCARWVEENRENIRQLKAEIPEGLNDRAADIWEPLLIIADLAGGSWPEAARAAALELSGTGALPEFTLQLLQDIEAIIKAQGKEKLLSRELVAALLQMPHGRWRTTQHGGPITERWLARHLRRVGIQSCTMRIGDSVGRGYFRGDFRL